MKRLLLLSVASCLGWQSNDTHAYLYYVSTDFSLDQQVAIREAFQEWEHDVGGVVSFTETATPDGSHTMKVYPHVRDNAPWVGSTNLFEEKIKIKDYLTQDQTRITALHEIGHGLGLVHTENGTIMSASWSTEHITCKDIFQFCGIWECDPTTLPPCQSP